MVGRVAIAGGAEWTDLPPRETGGGDDVDSAVRIVDPVDGHLVDAQPAALGQHQQFGVEEPAGIADVGQQALGDVGADGLESALGVGELGLQRRLEDQVVAARDELALGAAHHSGAAAEPRSDGQVGVPGDQRRDEGGQRGQIGGQVDVHVGQHLSVGVGPDLMQRAAAALLLEPHHPDVAEFGGELGGDHGRVVDAGVVGDGDADRVGEVLAEVAMQSMDRIGEGGLLVVDGHHDIEHGHAELTGDEGRIGPGFETRRRDGRQGEVGHAVHPRIGECVGRLQKLCTGYEFFGGAVRS